MKTSTHSERGLWRANPPWHVANRSSSAAAEAALEFGRCRVLLRRRQLLADGVPVELGTRAFDLPLVLLEADGSLVTKEELMRRVWPGIVVSQENLKVQVSALRKALGADRDVIRTEFGRGYRLIATIRWRNAHQSTQRLAPQWIHRRSRRRWCVRPDTGSGFRPAHKWAVGLFTLNASAARKGEQR